MQERIEELEAEIAHLKQALGIGEARESLRVLGLSETEAGLIEVLLKRDIASYPQLTIGASPDDLDRRYRLTARDVKVPLYSARKKLQPYGIAIENIQGRGYRMPPDSKTKLRKAINGR